VVARALLIPLAIRLRCDAWVDTQLLSRLKPAKPHSGVRTRTLLNFLPVSCTNVTKINGAVVLARRRVIRVWLFPGVRFVCSKLLARLITSHASYAGEP
jgi:hypothetical protein